VQRLVLATLAVVFSCSCGLTGPDDAPPQLISVQVLEGVAPCRGCPIASDSGSGQDVTPGADNVLTIKPNQFYTFRAKVRTAWNYNQCVYNVFHIGWADPDRTFDCIPETTRDITIDRITGRTAVPLTDTDIVTISLAEWTIDKREKLSSTDVRTYTIQFPPAPEPAPAGDSPGRRP